MQKLIMTNLFSISGEGKTVYFDKKNLLKDNLNLKIYQITLMKF